MTYITYILVQHDRNKHVEVDKHFIKETLESEIIDVPRVKIEDQFVDFLTKVISTKVFHGSHINWVFETSMNQVEEKY